jgi:hypothetical protein
VRHHLWPGWRGRRRCRCCSCHSGGLHKRQQTEVSPCHWQANQLLGVSGGVGRTCGAPAALGALGAAAAAAPATGAAGGWAAARTASALISSTAAPHRCLDKCQHGSSRASAHGSSRMGCCLEFTHLISPGPGTVLRQRVPF